MIVYDYNKQRVVHRFKDRILSIKPMFNSDMNKYDEFYKLANDLKKISTKFPSNKFVAEVHNIPDDQYTAIKDDVAINDCFTDHINKFFYNVNVNAVIIAFKSY
jgi:hypothetical protein